jgi:hypothetical protein
MCADCLTGAECPSHDVHATLSASVLRCSHAPQSSSDSPAVPPALPAKPRVRALPATLFLSLRMCWCPAIALVAGVGVSVALPLFDFANDNPVCRLRVRLSVCVSRVSLACHMSMVCSNDLRACVWSSPVRCACMYVRVFACVCGWVQAPGEAKDGAGLAPTVKAATRNALLSFASQVSA